MSWKSVNEESPKSGDDIIIAIQCNLRGDKFETEFGRFIDGKYYNDKFDNVTEIATYWMPKPLYPDKTKEMENYG